MEEKGEPIKVYMSLQDGIWLGICIAIGMGIIGGLVYAGLWMFARASF